MRKIIWLAMISLFLFNLNPFLANAYERELPKKDLLVSEAKVTLFIRGPISAETASNVEMAFWAADVNQNKTVVLEINSCGGDVLFGLEIIARMNEWKKKGGIIETKVYGQASSMALLIFASGTKGHRFANKDASLIMHQIQISVEGFESTIDTETRVKGCAKRQAIYNQILADASGKSVSEIEKIFEGNRDTWMFAPEALSFGIADKIIE